MDYAENYIEKQRQLEKYGLMNGDGKRVYMSYNKYLQQKADFPLYLATAEPNQIGNLQAELPDRNNNVTQKIKKSSANLTDFYKGAEIFAAKADRVLENQLVEQAFSPDYQKMKIALNDIRRRFPNVNIELTENYDTLSDTEKEYYNGKTDIVIIFADNVKNSSQLEKTFCHKIILVKKLFLISLLAFFFSA